MLLPRFSIRWMLLLTTVLAVLSVVVRQATLGSSWAIALTATVALSAAIFLLYGVMFLLACGLASLTRTLKPPQQPENPFVIEGQYPPQDVPRNPYGNEQL